MSTSLRIVRSSLRAAWRRQSSRVLVRHAHTRKSLPYPIEGGLGEFLNPKALRTLAVEYQEGLLNRLNEETRGTSHENKSVVQTIIETSWDRSQVIAYNYASEALNNSFFLESLTPSTKDAHESNINADLLRRINRQIGSLTQLKSIVSAHALGMFSSGWVWLVADQSGALGAISTFGTGTLLVRSRHQMGGEDDRIVLGTVLDRFSQKQTSSRPSGEPNVSSPASTSTAPASPTSGVSSSSSPLNPPMHTRSLHTSVTRSQESFPTPAGLLDSVAAYASIGDEPRVSYNRAPQDLDDRLGETLYPLFCVSVHERSWMSGGYGVWGKEEYMKRFWSVLNWKKVSERYMAVAGSFTTMP
ncbi:hypothetical protein GLOTRDRAFT_114188 [Gloeophyllum trabeum ATCC 11539]|uniref:Manganese/iron superoxide dismutase C-terminal domain-containing protein n=1 Tax=Gloeophyllum trabeum (strain ATCC 11539 / FP-39264 / Madison 617) TaxID=670483 RepID=S7QJL9_GLOTA|nr:uncharacterized protein GLOTRDRAFT_114188 [Gloeophyllum trabeum ATCC 11539]EPQ59507.1 hypothetical protein GLOTRDRAFT_114188 [Gloeophyllum trabeum ATCC 11539]